MAREMGLGVVWPWNVTNANLLQYCDTIVFYDVNARFLVDVAE